MGECREQAGALRPVRHGPRLEGRGIGRVQPPSFRGEQVVVDRLGQEGVAEAVGVDAHGLVADHDLAGQGLAERSLQLGLRDARDGRQQLGSHAAPGHGGHAKHSLGFLGQGGDPGQEHVAKGLGQAVPVRLGAGRDELLDEERVSLGAALDAVDEARCRYVVEDRRDLRIELRPPEPRQLEPLDARQPLHLGQPRPEGMTPVQLVGPVRADDDKALGPCVPGQERGDVTGRAVGPVEVLEDQDDRSALTDGPQQRQQPLEDAGLDPFGSVERAHFGADRRPELGNEPSELCSRR